MPGYLFATLAGLLLMGLAVAYTARWDIMTAVTVYPPWCWFIVGVLLLVPVPLANRPRLTGTLLGLWIVFLALFFDSPASLVRGLLPPPKAAGTLRVITFNCESKVDAAREVIAYEPDVVLFQETAGLGDVQMIATELYGERAFSHWAVDCAFITGLDAELVAISVPRQGNYIHAHLETAEGVPLDAIAIHMLPSVFRTDLWNPACWRDYSRNHRNRRQQMERLVAQLATIPSDHALLVGGDFNAPPGDAIFRQLSPRLRDSFPVAGRGWGRTFMSGLALLRIDQFWASRQLEPVQVFAVSSQYSDHCIVVADFALSADPNR